MGVTTYDPSCYELAEHFLKDEPISEHSTPYEQACHDLALTIQQAVEEWFGTPSEVTRPAGARQPEAWDAPHNRTYEPVEKRAAEIYATFVYDEAGEKPAWKPGGNSLKQDEARQKARDELRAGLVVSRPHQGSES